MYVDKGRYARSKFVKVSATLIVNTWFCFSIKAGPKNTWKVEADGSNYVCNCPDFARRGGLCKHIIAVMEFRGEEICLDDEKDIDF